MGDLMNSIANSDRYGFLIVIITIIVRIFVVSIAWNYGIFVLELNKSFPNSKLVELEFIAGLAQGLGSLIAPLYLIIIKRFGIQFAFTLGLALCCFSLFSSSLVQNEHLLLLTYSIPFGIGSSLTMLVGTLLTGLYFPTQNKFHMLATIAVSIGFPLGYLILNPLTEHLFQIYNWQFVKRLYGSIALICIIFFSPLFTDKKIETKYERLTSDNKDCIYPSRRFQIITNAVWFLGLFLFGLAINALVINLNGYFESININSTSASHLMMILGASDVIYRLLLSISGYFFKNLLVIFYIVTAMLGILLTLIWSSSITYSSNALLISAFALCSSVFMSLQYPIGAEINGVANIQNTYTLNVMISGMGLIVGPTLSGALLDSYNHDYKAVFKMSSVCFTMSMFMFFSVKALLIYARSKK